MSAFDPQSALELSLEEILEDLCWPHPPPGRWDLDAGRYSANGRAQPVDVLLTDEGGVAAR